MASTKRKQTKLEKLLWTSRETNQETIEDIENIIEEFKTLIEKEIRERAYKQIEYWQGYCNKTEKETDESIRKELRMVYNNIIWGKVFRD